MIPNVIEWLKRDTAAQFITEKYQAKYSFNSLPRHVTFAQARQTWHTGAHGALSVFRNFVYLQSLFSSFLVFIPLSISFMFFSWGRTTMEIEIDFKWKWIAVKNHSIQILVYRLHIAISHSVNIFIEFLNTNRYDSDKGMNLGWEEHTAIENKSFFIYMFERRAKHLLLLFFYSSALEFNFFFFAHKQVLRVAHSICFHTCQLCTFL